MASVYVEPWTPATVTPQDIQTTLEEIREGEEKQGNRFWNGPVRQQERQALEAKNQALRDSLIHGGGQLVDETVVLEKLEEAKEAQSTAAELKEDYRLEHTTTENLMTMLRAVDRFGGDIASKYDINPRKVEISHYQLDAVLGNKLRTEGWRSASVDAATYMITALALARMEEETDDQAERTAADWALDTLKQPSEIAEDIDIITNPEQLRRVRLARTLGPRMGEIAANAVVKHHLATIE